jgi:aspartate ammonia-lyase
MFTFSQNLDAVLEVSGAIRGLATAIGKIANDIRLLSSGPRTGLAELKLPAVQPGSSIMPGKVNPVMAEMMNMICYQALGCDTTVQAAVGAAQLELNVMMPHIDYELTRSEDLMTNGMAMFRRKLIEGLEADEESSKEHLARSFGSAALMNPYLGYDTVASIVKEAIETGKSIKELALKTGKIDSRKFDEIMASGIPR